MSDVNVTFRDARHDDLPQIIAMLADDPIGQARERTDPADLPGYQHAFTEIEADPNNQLIVGIDASDSVVAVLQLTCIPNLSRGGMRRAQIEGVRVASHARGGGVGERLIRHAIDRARQRGCGLVQLTTDRQRPDALRFYQRLGFRDTHHGMKLFLG